MREIELRLTGRPQADVAEGIDVFLSPPDVSRLELDFVSRAMESGWLAPKGPDLDAFEVDIAEYCGRKYAVGLSSGTAALHLALLAAGVKKGDTVVCSTLTFVATANAISYIGAIPYFIDSDRETGNISPDLLGAALALLRDRGDTVGAVVPVDFLGFTVNYSKIIPICEQFGIPLICDSAESLGASHKGQPAGSHGLAAAISFNGNKILTTSGGGMVLTDDYDFAQRVRHLATHAREAHDHYEHVDLGYNYRLSNVLAAIGRAQLTRLPSMISLRKQWRQRYVDIFKSYPGIEVLGAEDSEGNYRLTAIVISAKYGWGPGDLSNALKARRIETRPLWKPMHLQPLYQRSESKLSGASEFLFSRGLVLPSGSSMTPEQWERIEDSIRHFLEVEALI